jgi:hypothetical protein
MCSISGSDVFFCFFVFFVFLVSLKELKEEVIPDVNNLKNELIAEQEKVN